jgi:hypothetical protein
MRRQPEVNSRPPKTAEFLGFSEPIIRAERVSPKGVLAEGEELSSNPLL